MVEVKKVRVGDVIEYQGMDFVVSKVIRQICYAGLWDVEFEDIEGNYHRWNQQIMGGSIRPEVLINKCWDLWADEEKPFCPCCIYGNEENCNKCFGLDFHEEFIDFEKAEHLFEDNTTVYVVYSDNGEEYGRYGYEPEAEYHASCIGGYVEEL